MKLLRKSARFTTWFVGICALFAFLSVIGIVGSLLLLALILGAM